MTNTITVNEQPQQFYLAMNKWEPVVGHEIKVGEYRFCAIPLENHINVSEITTGARVMKIYMTPDIMAETETKEDAMKYFGKIAERLEKSISERGEEFDSELKMLQQIAFEQLGKMPEIEEVNVHD